MQWGLQAAVRVNPELEMQFEAGGPSRRRALERQQADPRARLGLQVGPLSKRQ